MRAEVTYDSAGDLSRVTIDFNGGQKADFVGDPAAQTGTVFLKTVFPPKGMDGADAAMLVRAKEYINENIPGTKAVLPGEAAFEHDRMGDDEV